MGTEAEVVARRAAVRRLFRLDGDAFVQEVLNKHRGKPDRPTEEMRSRLRIFEHELLGRKWYKLSSKECGARGKTSKILYLHGGGFVLESGVAQYDFVEYLICHTGAEVWFPEYHLAPEYTCLNALDMVEQLYRMMLAETLANEIALMGDSAGGGLAISAAMWFLETGLPLPNQLIALSPAVEFKFPTDPDELEYQKLIESRDPMISLVSFPTIGRLWRGELSEDDYRAVPIAGETKNLPPMLVFAGTGEAMNLSIRHFVWKAQREGANIRFFEKEMMHHCWVMFPGGDNTEERQLITERLNTLSF